MSDNLSLKTVYFSTKHAEASWGGWLFSPISTAHGCIHTLAGVKSNELPHPCTVTWDEQWCFCSLLWPAQPRRDSAWHRALMGLGVMEAPITQVTKPSSAWLREQECWRGQKNPILEQDSKRWERNRMYFGSLWSLKLLNRAEEQLSTSCPSYGKSGRAASVLYHSTKLQASRNFLQQICIFALVFSSLLPLRSHRKGKQA